MVGTMRQVPFVELTTGIFETTKDSTKYKLA